MKKHNQNGFGLIGSLIVVMVLAVIAFGGYYAWHTHHTAKPTTTTKLSTPASNSSSAPASTQNYLTIKEWGVRAPYSRSLNLQYGLSNDKASASVTSSQLLAADAQCTRGGAILRALPTDPVSPAGTAAKDLATQVGSSGYAYIGGYYYFFLHDQAACSDKDAATTLQTQNNDAVKALVPNLQAIPQ